MLHFRAMSPRGLFACAIVALGCRPAPDPVGFGSNSTSVTTLPVGTTDESSTGPGVESSSSTTSSAGTEDSGSSTGPRLDLGDKPDLDHPQPAGCKGKIDFLFVISSGGFVEGMQEQLIDAFPKFIETIQDKFADFDYHILVADGGADYWGSPYCTKACPMHPEPACVGYPCDLLDLAGPCETTWGAGNVFNVGQYTTNTPCDVAGGKRFLTREQPQLAETFECIARVGAAGADLLGHALAQAISPELGGPGGCNEGFLRDDALLVITMATRSPDFDSPGSPPEWAHAVIEAKHDDPDAIVAFGIVSEWQGKCDPMDRICEMIELFPFSLWIDNNELDYGPGFDAATDLVETACGAFIPQ